MLSDQQLAMALLTVGFAFFGLVGTARLLRTLGAGSPARYAAAAALLGGPATRALAAAGDWPGFMAVAVAPWAMASVLKAWPSTWRGRIGYLARAGFLTGVLGAMAPVAILLPLAAVILRAVIGGTWSPVLRALPAAGLALPFLLPWINWVSVSNILEQGTGIYFAPSVWAVAGVALAAVLTLLGGDGEAVMLAGWGGALAAGGALLGRTAGLGVGREPGVAGLVMMAVGTALIVGAAVDVTTRLGDAALIRRVAGWGAVVAGVVAAAAVVLLVPAGRLGLPEDRYGTQLDFAAARADAHGPDRILIVGPADELPGESRESTGFSYRVVPGSGPLLAEAWLARPREGDAALEAVVGAIASGEDVRPGSSLAPFGIRWVVFTDDSFPALESQFDMDQLPGLEYTTFENEVFSPRAVGADGSPWRWDRPDYVASGGGVRPVYISENQDPRWGEEWLAAGWANQVGGAGDRISFGGNPVNRRLAMLAAAVAALLAVAGIVGREGTG